MYSINGYWGPNVYHILFSGSMAEGDFGLPSASVSSDKGHRQVTFTMSLDSIKGPCLLGVEWDCSKKHCCWLIPGTLSHAVRGGSGHCWYGEGCSDCDSWVSNLGPGGPGITIMLWFFNISVRSILARAGEKVKQFQINDHLRKAELPKQKFF